MRTKICIDYFNDFNLYLKIANTLISQNLKDGKLFYDASTNENVFVRCPVMCVLADNPRASEFEHHLGSSAKRFCRKCNVSESLKIIYTII